MRVKKSCSAGTTRSYYDGQMPTEEDFDTTGTSSDTVTRNFVGARGIEAMTVDSGSGAVTSYPLYDTHGNMIATVRPLSGGTAWDIADERNYDVWGGVRQGNTTGGPKGRYVANLGHVQDDESGLIYMRARYYEPESGRFISEDPRNDGGNWYIYARNAPASFADFSGTTAIFITVLIAIIDAISIVGTGEGIGLLAVGGQCLRKFATALLSVKDSADVEEAYGQFMYEWNYSLFSSWDDSGAVGLGYDIIGLLSSMVAVALGGPGAIIGTIGILVCCGRILQKFGVLCMGYSMRLSWYLDDIDSE
ncbi:MAG: RHS repeat-associated core domain-containing protein [Fimbriimonadaceae bacterium]|nr:MAG: RHS repeat-associated core domain-containing protein [Fimbriimonadaceae bacterium]